MVVDIFAIKSSHPAQGLHYRLKRLQKNTPILAYFSRARDVGV